MIEDSPFGRIVIPESLPLGRALFYTTAGFDGRLNGAVAQEISDFIGRRFGIDSSLNTCTQVHGAAVLPARPGEGWRECDACDALWTAHRHVALGIKVADCLPVTIIDPQHDVLANVHSGWRGAVQRITAVTLDTLERETSFAAAGAQAYLGPAIRVCCFEVGEEVASQFDESFVDRTDRKPHVDMVAMTAALLRGRGFDPSRIFDSGLCTRCDGSIFHSFRRGGSGGGRNLAIAAQ